jgi:putative 4-mercaptohistidine N1-methyltranferase
MSGNYYESDRALAEYLLFHYGAVQELMPPGLPPGMALHFHVRCVDDCLDLTKLPAKARALDLGCAVGRSSFELARRCAEVVGVDYSERFITIAEHLRKNGSFLFGYAEEGDIMHPSQAVVPQEIDRNRVRFMRGDAMKLPDGLGKFDAVLMANLIDRLGEPRKGLAQLPGLMNPGGQLVITSPYTWLAEYTPKENWLGGFERDGQQVRTLDSLKEILEPHFQFSSTVNLPFLIREHARKFQLCVAEGSVWFRK